MSSHNTAPPTRHPHESTTTPRTGIRHESVTTPHDSLCASLSCRPAVVTHSRPRPPVELRRGRSSCVKVADLHDGSSITIGAHDTNRPQKRKGQSYQTTDKRASSQQRGLSLPDALSAPAAEPAPPPPDRQGLSSSLSQSSSTSNSSAQPKHTFFQDARATRFDSLASPTQHNSHNPHLPPPTLHDDPCNEVAPTQLSFVSPRRAPVPNSSLTTASNTLDNCSSDGSSFQPSSSPALSEPTFLESVPPSSIDPSLLVSPSQPAIPTNRHIIDQQESPTDVAAESTTSPVELRQPHPPPPQTEDLECNNTEPRICWCLQQSRPPSCKHCFPPPESGIRPSRCNGHETIPCSICERPFHRICVWSILHHTTTDNDPEYTCAQCLHDARDTHDPPWNTLRSCSKKNLRYGLPKPNRHESELCPDLLRSRRHAMKSAMKRCNGPAITSPLT